MFNDKKQTCTAVNWISGGESGSNLSHFVSDQISDLRLRLKDHDNNEEGSESMRAFARYEDSDIIYK